MAGFVTVGRAGDVPEGEARAFDVNGRVVSVAHVDGRWFAYDDTCTHRMCSLADGELEGTLIICPCHGSEFDIETGEVVSPPATVPIAVFDVRVDGEDIEVGEVRGGA